MSLYVRAISKARHGTPAKFAKLCADHGLKWVAIGGPWHEDRKGKNLDRVMNKPGKVRQYAEALAKVGVTPHVWGYPWWTRVEKFVEDMERYDCSVIDGWLLDPELGMKRHPKEAAQLVHLCRESNPYRILGFTSYGLSKGHPTFPWDEFAEPGGFYPLKECDYGSPQLYDTPKKRVMQGMSEYAELGFDVVIPSFGLYKWTKRDPAQGSRLANGKRNRKAVSLKPAELNAHLLSFVDSEVPVEAMIGWAENFVNRPLWRTLHEWSERLESGVCSL
jgi:hypothetical protein